MGSKFSRMNLSHLRFARFALAVRVQPQNDRQQQTTESNDIYDNDISDLIVETSDGISKHNKRCYTDYPPDESEQLKHGLKCGAGGI
ncbi:hypothetical protein [Paenibacillus radicis (ex Xue et al. 2023)]|uniref:Uncharacterized protein n=1 Tax=Paenibacillus radicis (ex Xue et al. 2023) TaxID=2972489 RepID=A0ABT1YA90_9BACL|nr:hypothetical protein [Paenibacillus radicis (ex Xue et al. 2023)]MCR8630106.1 hypothetical protein [Paenibacillus radicis (ex Xue et al. 2023)]